VKLMLKPILRISLLLVLLSTMLLAQHKVTPEQYREMVISELQKQGTAADSVGEALAVAGIGEDVSDYLIIPVFAKGRVVAVYRNDAERSSVTQIASAMVLRSVRPELFDEHGAIETFNRLKLRNPRPMLFSCGPFSLFGTLEAGWYLKTGDSFLLLSLNGRIVKESEVAELWPDRVELLRSIGASIKTETSSPEK